MPEFRIKVGTHALNGNSVIHIERALVGHLLGHGRIDEFTSCQDKVNTSTRPRRKKEAYGDDDDGTRQPRKAGALSIGEAAMPKIA